MRRSAFGHRNQIQLCIRSVGSDTERGTGAWHFPLAGYITCLISEEGEAATMIPTLVTIELRAEGSEDSDDLARIRRVAIDDGGADVTDRLEKSRADGELPHVVLIEFTKTVGPLIRPHVAAELGDWLERGEGRTLRFKTGDSEAEATSAAQSNRLIVIANQLHIESKDGGDLDAARGTGVWGVAPAGSSLKRKQRVASANNLIRVTIEIASKEWKDSEDFERAYQVATSNGGERVHCLHSPVFEQVWPLQVLIEFTKTAGPIIGPVVGAALAAWLQGRAGRKLRLKAGNIEVEAGSEEELRRLLDIANQLHAESKQNDGPDSDSASPEKNATETNPWRDG